MPTADPPRSPNRATAEVHPALQGLLDALDLEPAGPAAFEAGHPNANAGHLFGGQVLAQGLVAAHRASGEGSCHSLHAYFLKRGSTSEPIRFEVTELRRSRAFCTQQVMATERRPIGGSTFQ